MLTQRQPSLPGMEPAHTAPPVPFAREAPPGRGMSSHLGIAVIREGNIYKASFKWEEAFPFSDEVWTPCKQTVNIGGYRDQLIAYKQFDVMKYTIATFFNKSDIELNDPYDWINLAYFGLTFSESAQAWSVRVWNHDPKGGRFDLLYRGSATNSGKQDYFESREIARIAHDNYYRARPHIPQRLLRHLCLRKDYVGNVALCHGKE